MKVLESIKPKKWGRLTCLLTLHSKKGTLYSAPTIGAKRSKESCFKDRQTTTKGKTHPGSLTTFTVARRCLPEASKHIPKKVVHMEGG